MNICIILLLFFMRSWCLATEQNDEDAKAIIASQPSVSSWFSQTCSWFYSPPAPVYPKNSIFADQAISVKQHLPSVEIMYNRSNQPIQIDFSYVSLNIDDKTFSVIPSEYETVISIVLSGCSEITNQALWNINHLQIECLNLSNCAKVTDYGIGCLKRFPLKCLDLSNCYLLTDQAIFYLQHFKSLVYLNLSGCPKITDDGIDMLKACKSLKHLNLSRCSKITNKGVSGLRELSLGFLDLSDCPLIKDDGTLPAVPVLKITPQCLDYIEDYVTIEVSDCKDKYYKDYEYIDYSDVDLIKAAILKDGVVTSYELKNYIEHFLELQANRKENELQKHDKFVDSSLKNIYVYQFEDIENHKLNKCQRYALSSNSFAIDFIKSLSYRTYSNISKLKVTSDVLLTDQDLLKLAKLPLRDLCICDALITDRGMKYLETITSLVALEFSRCHKFSDDGLQSLQKIPGLKALDIDCCWQITDKGLANLKGIRLEKLCIFDGYRITDLGIKHLEDMPLKYLSLAYCKKLTNNALWHLSHLPLTFLNISACPLMSDAALFFFKNFRLNFLNVSCCNGMSDAGFQYITHLPLSHFYGWTNPNITDGLLEHLSKIKTLEDICLSYCSKITNKGLQFLGQLPNVRTLGLCKTSIGYDGLLHLQQMPLETLFVNGINGINDECVALLSSFNKLHSLSMGSCPSIRNEGLLMLTQGSALKYVSIYDCADITKSTVNQLKIALPNLYIFTTLNL